MTQYFAVIPKNSPTEIAITYPGAERWVTYANKMLPQVDIATCQIRGYLKSLGSISGAASNNKSVTKENKNRKKSVLLLIAFGNSENLGGPLEIEGLLNKKVLLLQMCEGNCPPCTT